jgi:hypothetical protein
LQTIYPNLPNERSAPLRLRATSLTRAAVLEFGLLIRLTTIKVYI